MFPPRRVFAVGNLSVSRGHCGVRSTGDTIAATSYYSSYSTTTSRGPPYIGEGPALYNSSKMVGGAPSTLDGRVNEWCIQAYKIHPGGSLSCIDCCTSMQSQSRVRLDCAGSNIYLKYECNFVEVFKLKILHNNQSGVNRDDLNCESVLCCTDNIPPVLVRSETASPLMVNDHCEFSNEPQELPLQSALSKLRHDIGYP